jgi:hypothetical protein
MSLSSLLSSLSSAAASAAAAPKKSVYTQSQSEQVIGSLVQDMIKQSAQSPPKIKLSDVSLNPNTASQNAVSKQLSLDFPSLLSPIPHARAAAYISSSKDVSMGSVSPLVLNSHESPAQNIRTKGRNLFDQFNDESEDELVDVSIPFPTSTPSSLKTNSAGNKRGATNARDVSASPSSDIQGYTPIKRRAIGALFSKVTPQTPLKDRHLLAEEPLLAFSLSAAAATPSSSDKIAYKKVFDTLQSGVYNSKDASFTITPVKTFKGSFMQAYKVSGGTPFSPDLSNDTILLKAHHGEKAKWKESVIDRYFSASLTNYLRAEKLGLPVAKIYNSETAAEDRFMVVQFIPNKVDPVDMNQLAQIRAFFDCAVKSSEMLDLHPDNFRVEDETVKLIDFLEKVKSATSTAAYEPELLPVLNHALGQWIDTWVKAGLKNQEVLNRYNFLTENFTSLNPEFAEWIKPEALTTIQQMLTTQT